MDDTAYTVGALAQASGITVRTLHHWDAIGLLVPAERAGNGYRRYGAADVARLYRILALRRLGLSLEEIAAALDREGPELEAAVRAHLARVEDQLSAVTALRTVSTSASGSPAARTTIVMSRVGRCAYET